MDLKKQNLMFFLRATQHGGTEKVVVQLCNILKPYVNKIVVCSAEGFNTKLLNELGIQHYEIPDIENKSPKVILKVLQKVIAILKKEKISIVHTHHRMAAFYACILSHVFKFIFVNTSHNTFEDKRILTHMVYKKAKLIACGEMVKKNLVEYYKLPEKSIAVIHNSVEADEGKDHAVEMLVSLKDAGYNLVGNVGRLSEQKGMIYFIRSLPLVLKECPNVKYIIVGDGEERIKLEKLVKELMLSNNVFFMGYRNDIQNIMKQLDFVVLSSLWEGLPLTPIEAFSVGKTVVGTAVDGTVEIIKDNYNGYLIPVKDERSIAAKVIYLIENPDIRMKFEKAAYQTFKTEFSFQIYSERVLDYYKQL